MSRDEEFAMNIKSGFLLALFASCTATEPADDDPVAPLPPPAPAIAQLSTAATHDGEVQEVTRTPRGDVDGLVLRDGTVVRIPPHVFGVHAPIAGVAVHAHGQFANNTLRADSLTLGGVTADMSPPTTPPPPPPDDSTLATLDETGTIQLIVRNGENMPDALLLSDGATIVIGPPLFSAAPALRRGVQIYARGEGGHYPGGIAMHARTLEVGGATYIDDAAAPAALPPPPTPPTR
jgi:hypothetical protein